MARKVVVTGGAGFIGSHLVDALVERGDDVQVIDNYAGGKHEERLNTKATYHEFDVLNTGEAQKVMSGAHTVFHLAALPRVQFSTDHPVESAEANVLGTISVLTAATRAGVKRVVYSASSSAYGEQPTMPLSEEMSSNPANLYGVQKYVGELFSKIWSTTYGLETVCLRYFNIYGSRIDPHGSYAMAVGAFLLAKKEGRPLTIFGDGTITRDYTHVRDVVQANLLAAESQSVGKGEVINVGAGRNVSIQYLAELINNGKEGIQYGPPRQEAHDSKADNTKAKELLGWKPTISIEEGIAELKKEYGIT
ncbi:NAD-dependent epimerase/dehydratase family protein [Candidatus Parcubacteria bacterium]|nr:MAG: NAD-dependent epimerase/dehydratase family protein [Candidatus Parcubacteria bacterium]